MVTFSALLPPAGSAAAAATTGALPAAADATTACRCASCCRGRRGCCCSGAGCKDDGHDRCVWVETLTKQGAEQGHTHARLLAPSRQPPPTCAVPSCLGACAALCSLGAACRAVWGRAATGRRPSEGPSRAPHCMVSLWAVGCARRPVRSVRGRCQCPKLCRDGVASEEPAPPAAAPRYEAPQSALRSMNTRLTGCRGAMPSLWSRARAM